MGWLFGKKKSDAVKSVPINSWDERALRFPSGPPPRRVFEPDQVKAVAGLDRPLAFPEENEPLPPVSKSKPSKLEETPPEPADSGESGGPLYVKIDVYRRIWGEVEGLRGKLNDLQETNTKLESSEYNEEHNFTKLRRSIKGVHDRLLQIDKILFKG